MYPITCDTATSAVSQSSCAHDPPSGAPLRSGSPSGPQIAPQMPIQRLRRHFGRVAERSWQPRCVQVRSMSLGVAPGHVQPRENSFSRMKFCAHARAVSASRIVVNGGFVEWHFLFWEALHHDLVVIPLESTDSSANGSQPNSARASALHKPKSPSIALYQSPLPRQSRGCRDQE